MKAETEKLAKEEAEKRENELKVKLAMNLLKNTKLSIEDISRDSELELESVRKLAEVLKVTV